jgi:hypothetical protein
VTQNATDEEFWQFEARVHGDAVGNPYSFGRQPYDFFPVGTRTACEAMREALRRQLGEKTLTEPCIGPHYFKRTGPPADLSFGGGR